MFIIRFLGYFFLNSNFILQNGSKGNSRWLSCFRITYGFNRALARELSFLITTFWRLGVHFWSILGFAPDFSFGLLWNNMLLYHLLVLVFRVEWLLGWYSDCLFFCVNICNCKGQLTTIGLGTTDGLVFLPRSGDFRTFLLPYDPVVTDMWVSQGVNPFSLNDQSKKTYVVTTGMR